MRARFLPFVTATDASSTWMAAVRADLDEKVIQECSRHSLKKGNWSRLLPPDKAWMRSHGILKPEDELPEETYNTHPLWTLLANSLEYRERWRAPCKLGQHINILELKAFLREEKFLSKSFCGRKFLCGLDSQVSLGALVKGRASSSSLSSLLRSSLCYPIGSGLTGYFMYYASETNRADGPTRNSVPSPPSVSRPSWMNKIEEEDDYSVFDQWLADAERGVVEAPFDCNDLMNGVEVDCRPRQRVGRIDRRRVDSPAPNLKEEEKDAKVEDEGMRAKQETMNERSQQRKNPDVEASHNERYAKTTAAAKAALKEIPAHQFFFGVDIDRAFDFKGSLDLYSGSFGVAKQLLANGSPWVLTYEWQRSSQENLLDASVQATIFLLLELGCFLSISMAPICASFSMAVTPPVRTKRYPRGRPGLSISMRTKVREGNLHLEFTLKIVEIAERDDIGYFLENPDGSWFWRQKLTEKFRDPASLDLFRFSFCRFGTAWQKNTRIATSTRLKGLRMMCTCSRPHHQLRGYSRVHKKSWTSVAEPYPRGLCRLLYFHCAARLAGATRGS